MKHLFLGGVTNHSRLTLGLPCHVFLLLGIEFINTSGNGSPLFYLSIR